MKRKICVVTGTRAEYGLLRWLMEGVAQDAALELQLIVTGMHLSPEFGMTWRAIVEDGFHIDRKIEMLLSSDTPVGIAKSMGLGMIGFAEAFEQLAPDIVVLLGDRFEILSAASAAVPARIPIAHLHGGEVTEGAIDELIRHAVTKMAHFHFVATKEYRQRVIRMGERPDRVYEVGALGLDSMHRLKMLTREELEKSLGFRLSKSNLLVTFHPVTALTNQSAAEFGELLAALAEVEDTGIIFTLPNADTESRGLISMIETFVAAHPNACCHSSLGQLRYLSCMNVVDGVVGNSSSGLIEAPSLHKGTINIGERQRGRLKADSVIDCLPTKESIRGALLQLLSEEFRARLASVVNPYGKPGASDKVLDVLRSVSLENIAKKSFYDEGAMFHD